jgi:predicted RNA binding protein YcfA (HicA-like mRNA interferase family)
MPKIPGVSQRAAIAALQKAGFQIIRQSGHAIMSNGVRTLTIPRHSPINAYTMGNIAKQAGFTPDEFRKLL